MKIAIIGQKGLPARYGGIERHVEELSLELAKAGHEVLAYARAWYTPKDVNHYQGVKIIHTPTMHSKHLDAIVHTFTATIHALFQKPDVINYHGVGPSLLSFIPRLFSPRTRVVTTFHCIDRYHQKWSWFARVVLAAGEWTACRFAHETIATSKFIKNYCLNEFQTNTTYVPSGGRAAAPASADYLSEWNLTPGKYVFMAARLVKHKGAHYLIDAWKQIQRDQPKVLKGYKLVIAGGSVFTDKYVAELKQAAQSDPSIVLTGWVNGPKLDALFNHCALLVHPSENEGSPLVVLTAMATGKATLVSDILEHRELIPDNRFWFMNGNSQSLAQSLAHLLSKPELLRASEAANLKQAREQFNWKKITAETLATYEPKQKITPVTASATTN